MASAGPGTCVLIPFALSVSKGEQWHLQILVQVLVFRSP